MTEEYQWFAGLDDGAEDTGTDTDTTHVSYTPADDAEGMNSTIAGYAGLLNLSGDVVQSVEEFPQREFDDIDLNGSLCVDRAMNHHVVDMSGSDCEVAVIDMSSNDFEANDNVSEVLVHDTEPTLSDPPSRETGVLHIRGRVYAITSALVKFVNRYVVQGAGFVTKRGYDIVTKHSKPLTNATKESITSAVKQADGALKRFSTLQAVGDVIIESCYFAVDRTRTYTKWYATLMISDDPEVVHRRSVRSSKNIIRPDPAHSLSLDSATIKRRARFSTLSWAHRQLLHCTRDSVSDRSSGSLPPTNHMPVGAETVTLSLSQHSGKGAYRTSTDSVLSAPISTPVPKPSTRLVLDRFSALDALIAAFDAGSSEAAAIITDLITPPAFQEDTVCYSCQREFSISLFRHHCRHCGRSFCREHSQSSRRIMKYGYTDPVRVCLECEQIIDSEARMDRVQWRLLRVRDFLSGSLIPYMSRGVDRGVDKALRVVDGTLFVVKTALMQNYPAVLIVETVEILRRYGMSGLAGVLLRQDFVEAVETLKKISGLDQHYPISLHELTACIYYKLAIDRGLRGCNPDDEYKAHWTPSRNNTHAADYIPCPDEPPVCDDLLDDELDIIIRYSSLALMIAYEDKPAECQRMASTQGYTLLCMQETSEPEQPAFGLYATTSAAGRWTVGEDGKLSEVLKSPGAGEPKHCQLDESPEYGDNKEVVLVIRGTHSVQDVVTDIRNAPTAFPPPEEEIMRAIYGVYHSDSYIGSASASGSDICIASQIGSSQEWEWLPTSSTTTYACGGIYRSAMFILVELGACLVTLAEQGFRIQIVGHSLGGAVAALVAYMLRSVSIPNVQCYSYGTPSFVDAHTADEMKEFVTTIILHDDLIARVTPASIRLLMKEVNAFRSGVFKYLQQDWNDAITRATALWSPRWRDTPEAGSDASPNTLPTVDAVPPLIDSNSTENGSLDQEECVLVNEQEVIQLWLPGRLVHIYAWRGLYNAAVVPRDFPDLRRILVQGNIFRDHSSKSIFEALQEVRSYRRAPCRPPPWMPYNEALCCKCCGSSFTWHSTFRGEAQEYKERYNCRCCGGLVCGPCSVNRHPIIRLGLMEPSRVCDMCFYNGKYADENNP